MVTNVYKGNGVWQVKAYILTINTDITFGSLFGSDSVGLYILVMPSLVRSTAEATKLPPQTAHWVS